MSWFSGSAPTIDAQIEKATSEAIPFGDTDLATSLEITDLIRSKQVDSKEAMRSLKKRLTSTKNPNTQLSTLHLIDTCVKNGGNHFIVEISSREFIDSIVALIHNNKSHEHVKVLCLELIQNWSIAFKDSFQFKYLHKVYDNLKTDGYEFPQVSHEVSATLFDSNAPPEWEDSDACMICSDKFTMINRKHHCRNCGGVYCQTHSSKSIALPQLGITEPVRVCDTCYDEVKHKSSKSKKKRTKHQDDVSRARAQYDSDDDEDLKRALELSLKDSQANAYTEPTKPETAHVDLAEEDDEDMKAAIAASLRDMEQQTQLKQQQQLQQETPQQDNSGPYSSLLPRLSQGAILQTERPNSPAQFLQQQQQQSQLSPYVTSNEEILIRNFSMRVEEAKANPIANYDNQDLNDSYKKVINLKPKLSQELNDSFNKYETAIDMNAKLDTIMKLYNSLLDERIERNSARAYQRYERPQLQGPHQYASPVSPQQPQPQQYYSPKQQPVQAVQQPYLQAYQQYQNPQSTYTASPELQNVLPQREESVSEAVSPIQQQDTASIVNEAEQRYPSIEEMSSAPAQQQQQQQQEDEFSAPPPPPLQQEQPQYTQAQQQYYTQPSEPPVPKITDVNFPNVPVSKFPHEQQAYTRFQEQQQQQQQYHQAVPKEESLIEL